MLEESIFFWFLKAFIRWRNIVLKFALRVIFRKWMFRVDGKHFIFNGSWGKLSQFIMVLFLECYQLLFLFFKTFIIWRNLSLEFSLKVICRRWMFRGEIKHLVFNGFWRKLYQFIMVFFLELYQSFFLFFKSFIRWRKFSWGFSLKVIFKRCKFIVYSKYFILDVLWWENVLFLS